MTTSYFGCEKRNVKDAAQFYYAKNLEELTEREILELHLIKEAPSLYNPLINRTRLDEKVEEIIKQQNP